MSAPKIDPAVARAITTLRNKGFAVNVVGIVVPEAPTEAAPRTFKTKRELKAGDGFPCLVDENCTRQTRTLERSQVHATPATLQTEGHLPRV
jgi:hypothetical protein